MRFVKFRNRAGKDFIGIRTTHIDGSYGATTDGPQPRRGGVRVDSEVGRHQCSISTTMFAFESGANSASYAESHFSSVLLLDC